MGTFTGVGTRVLYLVEVVILKDKLGSWRMFERKSHGKTRTDPGFTNIDIVA